MIAETQAKKKLARCRHYAKESKEKKLKKRVNAPLRKRTHCLSNQNMLKKKKKKNAKTKKEPKIMKWKSIVNERRETREWRVGRESENEKRGTKIK